MNIGLVLVDIQNDYFKGGKAELFQPEKAAYQAKKILSFFRSNNLPVFYVKHVNIRKNVAFFIPKTSGIDIYKDVYPQDDEDVIIKHTPDSFFETSLRSKLADKKISHLVVCGMMTHMCIDTTVRSAKNFDYTVTLIEDACTTMDLIWKDNKIPAVTVHETFMAALNGTFAEIQTADEWIQKMS